MKKVLREVQQLQFKFVIVMDKAHSVQSLSW